MRREFGIRESRNDFTVDAPHNLRIRPLLQRDYSRVFRYLGSALRCAHLSIVTLECRRLGHVLATLCQRGNYDAVDSVYTLAYLCEACAAYRFHRRVSPASRQ